MKYAYEDLSDEQFEKLVILICQKLFGVATQGFTKGPDGGRDAKFIGTAESYPSKVAPWKGITIIQAKHTYGINKCFNEKDFFSLKAKDTILTKEIPRIKKLRNAKKLDNYMLFANRRLAGNANEQICDYLSKECNIPTDSLRLCGIDDIEMWLKQYPDIPEKAEIDPIDSPLIISPEGLAEIVLAIASGMKKIVNMPPKPRVKYERKNELNNMSEDYANVLRNRYLKDTAQIQQFLAAPENLDVLNKYETIIVEFQLKIISKRKNYQTFDEVMEYLVDQLFKRDPILKQHKRLTRAILFYMYWDCDIGKTDDIEAI